MPTSAFESLNHATNAATIHGVERGAKRTLDTFNRPPAKGKLHCKVPFSWCTLHFATKIHLAGINSLYSGAASLMCLPRILGGNFSRLVSSEFFELALDMVTVVMAA